MAFTIKNRQTGQSITVEDLRTAEYALMMGQWVNGDSEESIEAIARLKVKLNPDKFRLPRADETYVLYSPEWGKKQPQLYQVVLIYLCPQDEDGPAPDPDEIEKAEIMRVNQGDNLSVFSFVKPWEQLLQVPDFKDLDPAFQMMLIQGRDYNTSPNRPNRNAAPKKLF